MNVSILWSKLLDQVKSELTSLSYRTWFSDTELYKLNNGKAYIIVPMPIHKKHLQDNYYDIIVSAKHYKLNQEFKGKSGHIRQIGSLNSVCNV